MSKKGKGIKVYKLNQEKIDETMIDIIKLSFESLSDDAKVRIIQDLKLISA